VKARLDAGWQPIAAATLSASSTFTITIPASTYDMVRVHLLIAVSGAASAINARVNADSTAGLHRASYTQLYADGTQDGNTVDSTLWRIGIANVTFASPFEMTIYDTDASSQLPMQVFNTTFHTAVAGARTNLVSGRLLSARLLSSLVITPSAGTMTGRYVAEGYLAP
jgi:hypothetical protein